MRYVSTILCSRNQSERHPRLSNGVRAGKASRQPRNCSVCLDNVFEHYMLVHMYAQRIGKLRKPIRILTSSVKTPARMFNTVVRSGWSCPTDLSRIPCAFLINGSASEYRACMRSYVERRAKAEQSKISGRPTATDRFRGETIASHSLKAYLPGRFSSQRNLRHLRFQHSRPVAEDGGDIRVIRTQLLHSNDLRSLEQRLGLGELSLGNEEGRCQKRDTCILIVPCMYQACHMMPERVQMIPAGRRTSFCNF